MPRILINPNHTKLEISNPDTPHTMHTSNWRSHATSTFPTPTHHIPCTHPTAGHTPRPHFQPRHTTYHAHIQLQVTRHVHISNPDTPHTMHTSHCRSHATSTFPTPTHHIPCTHPTAGHTPRPHFQPRHTTYHAHIQLQVGWLKSLNVPQRADIGHFVYTQQCTSDIQIWMMNIQIYKYTIHPVSSLRVYCPVGGIPRLSTAGRVTKSPAFHLPLCLGALLANNISIHL